MEVVKCSRLHHPDTAGATYCTLDLCNGRQKGLGAKGVWWRVALSVFFSTASLPCQPLVGVWRSQWALREFRLRVPDPPGTIGIRYRLVGEGGREEQCGT